MHGAQLQQIHLGFVNYRSELYNQLVYISYTYLQAQSAFRSRGPGEGPRYLVVRNAFLPVSNRGRVTDRAPEDPRLQQKFQRRSDFMSIDMCQSHLSLSGVKVSC